MDSMSALKWVRPNLKIIDQLLLPHEQVWIDVCSTESAHKAIKTMQVRGAPAIGVVAALGIASDILHTFSNGVSVSQVREYLFEKTSYLSTSRPTAVNLFEAMDLLKKIVAEKSNELESNGINDGMIIVEQVVKTAESLLERDLNDNKAIGKFGSEFLIERHGESGFSVLTHCNTGSLATAGYGTALGIIRSLHKNAKNLGHVYCTETRPYNQGSRLTAYELFVEKIDFSLVTDSMVSYLISRNEEGSAPVKAIIVGADRVARNGDTANKIGTFQLALIAKHFGIDFIVAVPVTSIDLTLDNGSLIPIEYRNKDEVTTTSGVLVNQNSNKLERATVRVAPFGDYGVWNPSFDVTPANLITAIITEKGTIKRHENGTFDLINSLANF
ncbi:hypothetical protein BB559_000184 [Furculomyces boomerangus]|uniref:Methylthioribose-1-phosphate isomerase n=2 Tax=Harpellales TaxID=61421 RepID=A0A2T9Y9G6_9FUNG|nr:hypothetical protein BB559_007110 [Furculomyces boomerangus]PVU88972.1 hypothetical protein BB559_005281 [Furculomyces boomerangus]PVV00039.1 hypothetical protein BB559_000184 [Furculomyces boomerangus]PVZ97940.1 hypothetical protein BB558_006088 [Smittium angustum]